MTKAMIIKELVGTEFHFSDYGVCGLNKNGDVIHWGEVCKVEIDNGDYVKANLYKLPKKWASACLHSSLFYGWTDPDDTETRSRMTMAMLEEEVGEVA